MEIKDKVALVTGGARRVGRITSLALAERGGNVIVNYNSSEAEAQSLVKEIERIGRKAIALKADVSNAAQVDSMVSSALNHFGRIDILVNNAAIFYKTPFLKITEEDWDSFMDINLKGVFLCAQKVGKVMLEQGAGKIINIADSDGGMKGWKSYIPYCVSKAGVIMFTKTLAKALAPNIYVNAVAPGPVMLAESFSEEENKLAIEGTLLKRVGSGEDIAKAVVFLIESDYITGEVLAVDGGSQLV